MGYTTKPRSSSNPPKAWDYSSQRQVLNDKKDMDFRRRSFLVELQKKVSPTPTTPKPKTRPCDRHRLLARPHLAVWPNSTLKTRPPCQERREKLLWLIS